MSRFDVNISAVINTEDGHPFAENTLSYHNLSYDNIVELEQAWVKFYQLLVDLGVEKANQKKS